MVDQVDDRFVADQRLDTPERQTEHGASPRRTRPAWERRGSDVPFHGLFADVCFAHLRDANKMD